jgi:hypothetical protein
LAICETGDVLPVETCIRRRAGIAARTRLAAFVREQLPAVSPVISKSWLFAIESGSVGSRSAASQVNQAEQAPAAVESALSQLVQRISWLDDPLLFPILTRTGGLADAPRVTDPVRPLAHPLPGTDRAGCAIEVWTVAPARVLL